VTVSPTQYAQNVCIVTVVYMMTDYGAPTAHVHNRLWPQHLKSFLYYEFFYFKRRQDTQFQCPAEAVI